MVAIKENISLKQLSTIQTGGPAEFLAVCKNDRDIIDALHYAKARALPVEVLGGGSNSLISDAGVKGLVLKIELEGFTVNESGLAVVSAGVSWDFFVAEMCRQAMTGVEALSGIPGLVGATPIQNVGAYGQEVSETIKSVRAIHRQTFKTHTFSNDDCRFSYRNSRFKSEEPGQWIVTEVTFQLDPTAQPSPRYEELKRAVLNDSRWSESSRGEKILLTREHVLKIRAAKGMVINPSDADSVSLGSFFTNPLINDSMRGAIEQKAKDLKTKTTPIFHRSGDNLWKASAAWLIENSGISKGFTLGSAKISSKHVLAITNPGNATTSDILKLQMFVEDAVYKTFSIRLEREPVFLGQ